MAKPTKAERSAAAKKGAAARRRNEAKGSGNDLKKTVGNAAGAAKGIGEAGAGVAGKAVKAVLKRVVY